jgi:DNA (cytosine-5)-methyltransferase 1
MTVIELFAGLGSQTQALKNIGIAHEVVGISEIDKYAIKTYEQLHGKVHNFGDIKKIESLPYCDFFTYSFPCQDLSIAGKQEGISDTQLYKMAGNSIVVNVLEAIFKNLFKDNS